jgi:signal transduction histidine kinase
MIELPMISLDLMPSVIQNFTIIATLLLLYHFIPDSFLSRSKLAYALGVGIVFGLAAAISIPAFWGGGATGSVIGFNIILIPLAGFIAGPVSAAVVAIVLMLGSLASNGSLTSTDLLTIMNGILLGALIFQGKSWKRFPRSYHVQIALLGAGVALVLMISSILFPILQDQPGRASPELLIIELFPFFIISVGGTVLLGAIIGFIDRKKQAERELHTYRDHLEGLVEKRTAELKRANALQRATFESTADGIVVADRDGIIRAYNRKSARILNLPDRLPKDEQGGGQFTDRLGEFLKDPELFRHQIGSLPESSEQMVTTSLEFRNGRIYELYVQPQMIGNQTIGRVWSLHDITDQKLAEDAIRSANNKLNLLADITRHDILNQLTALSAYLELVEGENREPSAAGHLQAMKKSLDIIRLQLEFTRDYQNLGLKKPVWQSAGVAFTHAAESFEGAGVTFINNAGMVEIFADPLITEAFYNLIDNSLRHNEKVSRIGLSIRTEDSDLVVLYEDDGTGVLPEEKEKIFLRGFGKHTGLGMFLIKEILLITGITIR